ncbi:MAG: hypothetical protein ACLP7P_16375 [Rhodomicrobium sp.]
MTLFPRLRLRIMLSLAPLLVNRAAKHSSRLKYLLETAPGAIQVIAGKKPVGFFRVEQGAFRWKRGVHPAPSFTQAWKTPRSALRVLTSKDETDILRASEAQELSMSGSFLTAIWFNEVMLIARANPAKSPEMIRRDPMTGQVT